MQQISDNVYGILTKLSYLNYYVIINGDAVTVIDVGVSKGDAARVEKELTAHGYTLDQVKHILITHNHPDHVGGLAVLQARTNATLCVHRLDAPQVRGEENQRVAHLEELGFFTRMMAKQMMKAPLPPPARVDKELQDDDKLDDVLPGLTVVHLPGHSYGQVGYWLPEKRLLIGGDVMMRMPWGLRMPLRAPSPDWNAAKRSIKRVADMDVDILCLGHGQPYLGGAVAHIRKFADTITI